MRYLVALFVLICASAATAQDFPALYRVTDVAANDVLNIRAQPQASAPVIGSFRPGQRGVEVMAR